MNQPGTFESLLDRIRQGNHPDYGTISWDGETRQLTVTVQFERNGYPEEDEIVRDRALRYLAALTPAEREVVEVDVVFRERKPIRAILRAGTGELPIERLQELQERAGLR